MCGGCVGRSRGGSIRVRGMSTEVVKLRADCMSRAEECHEFVCISIDATLKRRAQPDPRRSPQIDHSMRYTRRMRMCITSCVRNNSKQYTQPSASATWSEDTCLQTCIIRCTLPLVGQASYRASADVRNSAAFPDSGSVRSVLTIRGRTGPRLSVRPWISCRAAGIAYRTANSIEVYFVEVESSRSHVSDQGEDRSQASLVSQTSTRRRCGSKVRCCAWSQSWRRPSQWQRRRSLTSLATARVCKCSTYPARSGIIALCTVDAHECVPTACPAASPMTVEILTCRVDSCAFGNVAPHSQRMNKYNRRRMRHTFVVLWPGNGPVDRLRWSMLRPTTLLLVCGQP